LNVHYRITKGGKVEKQSFSFEEAALLLSSCEITSLNKHGQPVAIWQNNDKIHAVLWLLPQSVLIVNETDHFSKTIFTDKQALHLGWFGRFKKKSG
jgi:hypothetical protein